MERNEPTVFVVDDDPSAQDSLRSALESAGHRVQTYGGAREFLNDHDPALPGCLVLDDRMPELSGHELVGLLQSRGSRLPVVLVTGYADVDVAVDVMKRGVVDFLCRPLRAERLLGAVARALELDRSRRRRTAMRADFESRLARLTPREREVMDRVVAGKTNRAAAAELGITERTVEMHRLQMKKKMGVDTLADLVRLATLYASRDGDDR